MRRLPEGVQRTDIYICVPVTRAMKDAIVRQATKQGRTTAAYIRRCVETVQRFESETA
jgi:hypothetical protein